jgi:hypothetical protein
VLLDSVSGVNNVQDRGIVFKRRQGWGEARGRGGSRTIGRVGGGRRGKIMVGSVGSEGLEGKGRGGDMGHRLVKVAGGCEGLHGGERKARNIGHEMSERVPPAI